MTVERGYDILPQTLKACLLLAGAFVGGLMVAGYAAYYRRRRRRAGGRQDDALPLHADHAGVTAAVTVGRGYDIFPRTWKARLLLVIAFVGGLCLIAGYVAYYVFTLFLCNGWFEDPPCRGSHLEGCLPAQSELAPTAQASCEGVGLRICFVPLGQVDPDVVRSLVDYYGDEYGVDVGVLTPSAVPEEIVSDDRHQIDGASLAQYMATLFPADYSDPDVVLIGLTPLDLYAIDVDWRYEFGEANVSGRPVGVVSTYRMHFALEGWTDDELVLSRTRKMVTKYIGLMYYALPQSYDSTSPMYGRILSVDDLDRMGDSLFGP